MKKIKYPKFFVPSAEEKDRWTEKLVYCKLKKNGHINYVINNGDIYKSYWSPFLRKQELESNRWREIPAAEAVLL